MKFMNMKRFASTVLAGTMALSLAVPAMAEDQTTVITATYADTDLEVTVPATAAAVINPYGLPVQMEDAVTSLSGQPITIAAPLLIQNQSSVALKVGASIATTVETGMTLETADGGDYDTNPAKELYVEFQAFEAAGIDGSTAEDPTKTNPAWAGLKDADATLKVALDTAGAVDAAAVVTGDDLVLREGKDGLSQAGGVAFVRLSGKVAKKAAWAETDKLVATITYSFEPATYTKSAGTLAPAVTTISLAGTPQQALTFTSALPTGVTATETTYTSSDPAVVEVAANGANVTGKSVGTATVTVTIKGSDGIIYTATTATITVTA